MTIAEIHGKISDSNLNDRLEDLLTSDIFGSFRYLPPSTGVLQQFLQTAKTKAKDGGTLLLDPDVRNVYWSFWPSLRDRDNRICEPDVVIGLEDADHRIHLVMIEAKYHSGKSSVESEDGSGEEDDSPRDQLARELDCLQSATPKDLGWDSNLNIVSRDLVYVTEDVALPDSTISESLEAYRRKRNAERPIYWTSWGFLPGIIRQQQQRNELSDASQRNILTDLLDLLTRKSLVMFEGIKPLTSLFDVHDFTFYSRVKRMSLYQWPDFTLLALPDVLFQYRR